MEDIEKILSQAGISVVDGKVHINDVEKAVDAIAASDWSGMYAPVPNREPLPSLYQKDENITC